MSKKIKQEKFKCENLDEKYASIKMKKGITLIALVVTIVVLLILASVSITVVFGDNGILQLAKEAGEKTNEAVKNDISSIGELEDILHETQTGIKVDKVADTNPGELEESEENTYTINSIEDLVAFAHNVTSGENNYEGKTVKLGLSLDFASTKSYVDANRTDYGEYGYDGELKKLLNESGFIPIGTRETTTSGKLIENTFKGTFDGNKNKIYNLKIKQRIEIGSSIGLFSSNYGIIKNIEIQNAEMNIDIKTTSWNNIGLLTGCNYSVIENCGVTGSINGSVLKCKNIGGLCGANNSEISNCYSKCNINITGPDGVRIGGLVGANEGVNGMEPGMAVMIKNVYSAGNIYNTLNEGEDESWIGSILGFNAATIKNAYTIGTTRIMVNGDMQQIRIGNIYGEKNENSMPSDCYYLDDEIYVEDKTDKIVENDYGTVKTEKEMKSEDFVNLLNEGQEENPWKQDTNNINDGYPILSWQQ